MEYLLLIPLKKGYEIDLVKYLKVAISAQYGNVDDKIKENLETLNRQRNHATSKTLDTRQEHSLELLQKYYDQITLLQSKLPQADIPFKWRDSFEKGGIFSSGALTVPNIGYEKICILYNIAALMSQIGAYQGKEGSYNDVSLKQAIKHFQGAAGIFQGLKHTTSSAANTSELTFDLQSDVLSLLHHAMLAQAQEAFFYKASNDNMKEQSIARIVAQCSEFYGEVFKQINMINLTNKVSLPEWIDVFSMKQQAYAGVAEYYQAIVAQQKKDFGEQITRLTKALEFLKLAETKITISMSNKFKDIMNKAIQSLEEVKRDNDFIYHAKIPEYKSLPSISKAILAKATDLPDLYFPVETDLFQSLLPYGVHQSILKLDQRRQELVNTEIANLREWTQTLNAVLASLNLPASIEDVKGVEVPKSLQEKAETMKQKGGIEVLERYINELPDLLQRNKEILDEIERSMSAEEESDNKLKSQFKDKWTRTPSRNLNQTWKDHVGKYRDILKNAVEADNKVKLKYNTNLEKMKLLSNSTNSSLAKAIPSNNDSGSNVDQSSVNKLRQLMVQVDSVKKERESLEERLKNIEFEELKHKFMKSMDLHTDVNEASLSAETIGQFYGDLQKSIRESQQTQEKLIEEIRNANEDFVSSKGNSGNKRDQFLKEAAFAFDAFTELLCNLEEGTKFYNELTQLLVNLQGNAEREELCKDLQNEIVNRPNDALPKVPSYQKPNESNATAPSSTAAPVPAPPVSSSGNQAPYPNYPPNQPYYNPYGQYNYYPPPPLPSGYNPYMAPPGNPAQYGQPYYPQQYGYPGQQPPPPHGYYQPPPQ
ncbi:hypothetical protein RDWZM_003436 [Blomia tropicalis]|uniref:BRO1 domain-containing protein n=1 Tax=Blomia tropicalis TaxID=40697 RepID=A0A9Q0RT14_BLOTA|nr:hypothetical protein RDWZM_003436 [Blomia tropicalis]